MRIAGKSSMSPAAWDGASVTSFQTHAAAIAAMVALNAIVTADKQGLFAAAQVRHENSFRHSHLLRFSAVRP